MFNKYINKFDKVEAEWVLEVLDMHDGDEPKARAAVIAAVDRLIARNNGQDVELTRFDRTVDACCFASRNWWFVGLARLKELGRYPVK